MCVKSCAIGNARYTNILKVVYKKGAAAADGMVVHSKWPWYTRNPPSRIELIIWNLTGIAGGGLLGYGIGHIQGSLPSWKYEFLIVGAICCVWGIVIFIFLPDSPVTAPLLSIEHRRIAVERLRSNQTGVENKHFKMYQLKEAFSDYKLYLLFFGGMVGNIPNGGISNFGTLIIQGKLARCSVCILSDCIQASASLP